MKRFLILSLATAFAPMSWPAVHDLSLEWSTSQNPNGSWTLLKNPVQPFDILQPDYWNDGSNVPVWADERFPLLRHVPLFYRAPETNSWVQEGDIITHGAEYDRTGTNIAAITWTAPFASEVWVEGMVWMPTTNFRVMRWDILVGETPFCTGSLFSDGTSTRTNAVPFMTTTGGSGPIVSAIAAGQEVRLQFTSISDGGNLGDGMAFNLKIHHGPQMLIRGTVDLENWTAMPNLGGVVGILRDVAASRSIVWTGSVTLGENGAYALLVPESLPQGDYELLFRADHWLVRSANTFTWHSADLTGVNVSLVNGDIDENNEVGPGDFSELSAAFGSTPEAANWKWSADLDGDSEVGPTDFAILSTNFGQEGD